MQNHTNNNVQHFHYYFFLTIEGLVTLVTDIIMAHWHIPIKSYKYFKMKINRTISISSYILYIYMICDILEIRRNIMNYFGYKKKTHSQGMLNCGCLKS
jgi:hypothetical protein